MVMPGQIRVLALALFRQEDRILVLEGYDPVKGETFYRLPGGGVEFGEYGQAAIAREMREELGAEIECVRYLTTLENVFVYAGQKGHEVALLYEAAFVDRSFYARPEFLGRESDGSIFKMLWKPLATLAADANPLYPDGLMRWLV
jgi:ADP-ribose pyrophosphatase YjhB (NUDIX family)